MLKREALSVTQVNLYIKEVMDRDLILTDLAIKGEISNFKAHTSGHMYLSLKDEKGVLRAVMFRSAAAKLAFRPENGMKVVAHGRVSVYERDGQYQLYIDHMEQQGIGDLYVAFEKLKKKLEAEGLFDPAHKLPLPKYPKKIGVVTAPTGAAIRDIMHVLSRRFPYADVVLYPVLVQGENAAQSIAEAIMYFNQNRIADVLIVGRGGGSIEDLWSFNDEAVARAIYASQVPIISAVGHEIDFTISDFVADLRAPTPSAAAELAVPSQLELREKFGNVYRRLYSQAVQILKRARTRVNNCAGRPALKNPMAKLEDLRQYLDQMERLFDSAVKNQLEQKKSALGIQISKLDGLSPLGTIARGYAVVKNSEGKIVRKTEQTASGEHLDIMVADGTIPVRVE